MKVDGAAHAHRAGFAGSARRGEAMIKDRVSDGGDDPKAGLAGEPEARENLACAVDAEEGAMAVLEEDRGAVFRHNGALADGESGVTFACEFIEMNDRQLLPGCPCGDGLAGAIRERCGRLPRVVGDVGEGAAVRGKRQSAVGDGEAGIGPERTARFAVEIPNFEAAGLDIGFGSNLITGRLFKERDIPPFAGERDRCAGRMIPQSAARAGNYDLFGAPTQWQNLEGVPRRFVDDDHDAPASVRSGNGVDRLLFARTDHFFCFCREFHVHQRAAADRKQQVPVEGGEDGGRLGAGDRRCRGALDAGTASAARNSQDADAENDQEPSCAHRSTLAAFRLRLGPVACAAMKIPSLALSGASAHAGLRALKTVCAISQGIAPLEARLLDAVQRHLLGSDVDVDIPMLEAIDVYELARAVPDGEARAAILSGMVVASCIDGEASTDEMALLTRFAKALDVAPEAVQNVRYLASEQLFLGRLSIARNAVPRFVTAGVLAEERLPGLVKQALPMLGTGDTNVAAKYAALRDYAPETLGRKYTEFLDKHGISLPGEPYAGPESLVARDVLHVLSDYGTTASEAAAVAAFQAACHGASFFESLLFALAQFELSRSVTEESDAAFPALDAEVMAEGAARGATVDRERWSDFDLWDHASRPVDDVRAALGIAPRG